MQASARHTFFSRFMNSLLGFVILWIYTGHTHLRVGGGPSVPCRYTAVVLGGVPQKSWGVTKEMVLSYF